MLGMHIAELLCNYIHCASHDYHYRAQDLTTQLAAVKLIMTFISVISYLYTHTHSSIQIRQYSEM